MFLSVKGPGLRGLSPGFLFPGAFSNPLFALTSIDISGLFKIKES
jgi:hypothetical protein